MSNDVNQATIKQIRRGTAAEHESFVGAEGEITMDTTNKTLRVHDGVTPGGTILAKLSDIDSLAESWAPGTQHIDCPTTTNIAFQYVAPANGYYTLRATGAITVGYYFSLYSLDTDFGIAYTAEQNADGFRCFIPVHAGERIGGYYNGAARLRFYYTQN